MTKLNYHHLNYFYAIAKHGSIAKAAQQIHISPQTLSAQLNQLESQLGFQLFNRKGRSLVLNEEGQIAYNYAEEIFSLGDELVNSLKNQATNFAYKFSIGITDVIAKVFSFYMLKSIYTMDDSIKLVCKETNLEVLLGELAVNKLDAVLSDTPLPANSPLKAYTHLLGKCGLSFFATTDIAQGIKAGFPQSLDGMPFFTAGEGSNQYLSVRSWFDELDINPVIIGEFDDSVLSKYFGQAGYGVFCAPSIIEQHVIEQFNVSIVGRTRDITEHYYLISPERKIKHPAVKHLISEGKKLFAQAIT
ncbi:transcriptional activator NhaR [Colwellia sp. MEBiC06753]